MKYCSSLCAERGSNNIDAPSHPTIPSNTTDTRYLVMTDALFEQCISNVYVDAFYSGQLKKFIYTKPYPFSFLENFFERNFYNKISDIDPSLSSSYTIMNGVENFFEPFYCEEFIRLVYGKVFRKFLATLMNSTNTKRPKDSYPQLRSLCGDKGGMGIHDDSNSPYNGVAFFYLNNFWKEGDGGELVIWEKLESGKYKKIHQFAPIGNSISVMRFSPISCHSVNKPVGNWLRNSILTEWCAIQNLD